MALPYSIRQMINRVQRHMNDGFPEADYTVSEREMQLYIEEAMAFALVGNVYQTAKIEGNLVVPDGFLTTYSLPALQQDLVTREWYTTLPQVPLSLPLGYSLDDAYFADSVNGKGIQINLIKAKRTARRKYMPLQNGVNGRVEGAKFILEASDSSSLLGNTVYVRMTGTRITDIDAPLNVPDDILSSVFDNVVKRLIQRSQVMKDVVKDDIPAGNKAS